MTRMSGPDCAVMCNQVHIHTHTHTHTHKPGSVYAHRTEGVAGSERREGAHSVGGKIRIEGGNGDGNGVGGENGNVNGDGDRTGAGTKMEWRTIMKRKMTTRTRVGMGWVREQGRGRNGDVDEGGYILKITGSERGR